MKPKRQGKTEPVPAGSDWSEREAKAARTVAGNAADADDARLLLEALGLLAPAAEGRDAA
ncbi:hypothetical protein [Streptomyces chumphonensis]|uniref:hypothetical protein n=1 Tax=Streptomyces chumphonensis TaxID=1214925 RepID=UPI003D73D310